MWVSWSLWRQENAFHLWENYWVEDSLRQVHTGTQHMGHASWVKSLSWFSLCSRTGRAGNHGYAYTFITIDQGRYAGEIIKALDASESSSKITPELKALWEDHKKQFEAVGASGFQGKRTVVGFSCRDVAMVTVCSFCFCRKVRKSVHTVGLKAVVSSLTKLRLRWLTRGRSCRRQHWAYMTQMMRMLLLMWVKCALEHCQRGQYWCFTDSGQHSTIPLILCLPWQIDQRIEDMFAVRKRVTDVSKPMINPQVQNPMPNSTNQQKLELAKRLASKINMNRNLGPEAQDITQQAAAAIFKGGMAAPQVSVSCYTVAIIVFAKVAEGGLKHAQVLISMHFSPRQ